VLLRPGGIAQADSSRVLGAPLLRRDPTRRALGHACIALRAAHAVAPRRRGQRRATANAAVLARTVAAARRAMDRRAARRERATPTTSMRTWRALDGMGAAEILIEDVPATEAWNAVRDRLGPRVRDTWRRRRP
jgi:hypothetical protein